MPGVGSPNFPDDTKTEPFVGLIIGAYDVRMPTEESIVNLFYVLNKTKPMFVQHQLVKDNPLSAEAKVCGLLSVGYDGGPGR